MICKTQFLPEPGSKNQQFCINVRPLNTEALNANLMELAIASFLWPLMPEHGPGIPQPPGLVEQQTVLFSSANTPGCSFRPKRQAIAVTIVKGIHFLFDDVCNFTNRAFK